MSQGVSLTSLAIKIAAQMSDHFAGSGTGSLTARPTDYAPSGFRPLALALLAVTPTGKLSFPRPLSGSISL